MTSAPGVKKEQKSFGMDQLTEAHLINNYLD